MYCATSAVRGPQCRKVGTQYGRSQGFATRQSAPECRRSPTGHVISISAALRGRGAFMGRFWMCVTPWTVVRGARGLACVARAFLAPESTALRLGSSRPNPGTQRWEVRDSGGPSPSFPGSQRWCDPACFAGVRTPVLPCYRRVSVIKRYCIIWRSGCPSRCFALHPRFAVVDSC